MSFKSLTFSFSNLFFILFRCIDQQKSKMWFNSPIEERSPSKMVRSGERSSPLIHMPDTDPFIQIRLAPCLAHHENAHLANFLKFDFTPFHGEKSEYRRLARVEEIHCRTIQLSLAYMCQCLEDLNLGFGISIILT